MGGKKRQGLEVSVGEVYAGRVDDGRYACVHVIRRVKDGHRRGKDSVLLALLAYLGPDVPTIQHADVRRLLVQNRFMYKHEYSVCWTEKPPPTDYVLIGSYEPTKQELSIDPMGTYGSHWSLESVLWEWRWVNDRASLEAEVAADEEQPASPKPAARRPTEGSTIDLAAFWQIVGAVNTDVADWAKSIRPAIRRLLRRSRADIIEFEEMLAEKLYQLDTGNHAKGAGAAGASDDAFLYARCYVVARGRQFYERVLANPDEFPPDCDFEPLLSIASTAFEEKTGEDFEHETHCSYETGSNEVGWE